MCVYEKQQELVSIPTKSWSEYTMTQKARAGRNIHPLTKSELCTCKQEKCSVII